jgi:hypothetical protein
MNDQQKYRHPAVGKYLEPVRPARSGYHYLRGQDGWISAKDDAPSFNDWPSSYVARVRRVVGSTISGCILLAFILALLKLAGG